MAACSCSQSLRVRYATSFPGCWSTSVEKSFKRALDGVAVGSKANIYVPKWSLRIITKNYIIHKNFSQEIRSHYYSHNKNSLTLIISKKSVLMFLRAFSPRISTRFNHLHRPFSTTYLAKKPEFSPNLPLPILRETLRSIGTGTIHLDLHYRPGTALIRLDHPKTHNALSAHMMALLADAVDTLSTLASDPNDQTLVVIITGSPHKSFCAGLDLAGAREHFLTPQAGECFSSLMQDTLSRLFRLPLITIAAVNGAALGGGAELTTACDHRVLTSSPDSRIQFVQAKMGVSPGWGGGTRLVQLVGRTTALRLLGSSLVVTAENGVRLGMVDYVAQEQQDVVEAAVELAQTYQGRQGANMKESEHSMKAIKGMKKVVAKASERIDAEEMMKFEKDIFTGLWGGKDNLSAIARVGKKK